jgi:hypothetical protein
MGESQTSVIAHRRVHHQPQMLAVDQASNLVKGPSSAAFMPDSDGLSVYLDGRLVELGLGPSNIRTAESQVVAGLSAETITSLDLWLVADPEKDGPQPLGQAHALIKGWEELSGKQRKRTARELASHAVCTHPGGPWASLPVP